MSEGTKESCCCESCKESCNYKPGWFMPGQAEKVAGYLNISLLQLFQDKLAVDWWVADDDIFLLSPALINQNAGTEFPGDPRGACIFFKDGLCEIHPVKPFECAEMIHNVKGDGWHKQVAKAWKPHQDRIIELLGRKPKSASFGIFDMFNF